MIIGILSGLAAGQLFAFLAGNIREILPVILAFQLPVLLPLLACLAKAVLAWFAGRVCLVLVAVRVVHNLRHPEKEVESVSASPFSPELKEIAA